MTTIPASQIVNIIPGVLNAGGSALNLAGLILTQNTRVPIGTIQSFPLAASVSTYFGAASQEYAAAQVYFTGYTTCTAIPAYALYAQYNQNDVSAWLRGGPVSGLTIPQLQVVAGTLSITVDGYTRTVASLNLSSATSYTAAATLIQTALNTSPATVATITAGALAPTTFSLTASISGLLMTVTTVGSGTIVRGAILAGTGVTAGTQVESQISGTTGGVGVYAVSISQVVVSGTITGSYGTLTVTTIASGTISIGQTIVGVGVTAGTIITALGTGTGLTGTYFTSISQTVASEAMTTTATNVAVTYDSISGGFIITSGIWGTASTIAAASGTAAAPLFLTTGTGAVTSQGAFATTPSAFMASIIAINSNWASFMTLFDPDGLGGANTVKMQFAAWVNTTNDDFMYVCWDNDITPTLSTSATASMGYLLTQSQSNGTFLIYEPTADLNWNHAAFVLGIGASINFNAINGRITFAFKSQGGLVAAVTTASVAANLIANGYNFYGVYATSGQNFVWLYPGGVSGPYQWADAYVDQIWLNNALQQALMNLLSIVGSIPYNAAGYAMVEQAMLGPINAAILFGAIRLGIPLSNNQITQVNNAAGKVVAQTIVAQGFYISIQPASPQVRQARQSPTILLWYADGGSIQKITVASVDAQ